MLWIWVQMIRSIRSSFSSSTSLSIISISSSSSSADSRGFEASEVVVGDSQVVGQPNHRQLGFQGIVAVVVFVGMEPRRRRMGFERMPMERRIATAAAVLAA